MQDTTQPLPTTAGAKEAAPDDTDLTGKTLNDFRILRCLGQGGMGKVYLAEQLSLKRKVALKFLRHDLASNTTALRRFRLEAEAVARVTHANIVQVYAIGEVDGLHYMALEYVEGRNLREYLSRKGPPDVNIALTVMRQVAAALQKASEAGIVHRDIKPENILLTRKGEVKVADFGLSRAFGGDQDVNLTQSGMTLGTPMYMSPEQVQGKPLDPRSDIYSFGVTCYHMLAGQPPYKGATAFDVALQHVQGEAPPLKHYRPDLPPELCDLVQRMMSKNPEGRPQTGREILRELSPGRGPADGNPFVGLAAVVSPGPVRAHDAGDATEALPQIRTLLRPLVVVLAGLSIVVALAAGVGLRLWANAHSQPVENVVQDDHPILPLANDRERQLKAAVAMPMYANPSQTRPELIRAGASHHVELGLLLIEQYRYDEGEKFFKDMVERQNSPEPYKKIGKLGLAITYAMCDEADQSNKQFMELRPAAKARGRYQPILPPIMLPPEDLINLRFWMLTALERNATHMKDGVLPYELRMLREDLKIPWTPQTPNGRGKGKVD